MKSTSRLALLGLLFVTVPAGATPAFPGAEGFGANAIGGRGGRVLFVTNLDDAGPGSLRQAIDTKGPRTIVFEVSGTIALESPLVIQGPYITLAGQTAPGDGICLKNHTLVIKADHVIVRYLRCRPGDNTGGEPDAISISSGRDIIVDHCSASWAVDETLSASTSGPLGNVTVQWCIISESLDNSTHHKGSHGYGSLIRGGWGNGYTFAHNLYAHHHARNPRPGNYNNKTKDPNGFILDFRNNVIYNWGGTSAGYNADGSAGIDSITKMNFIGNVYKPGRNSKSRLAFSESCPSSQAFFSDNQMDGQVPDDPWSLVTFEKMSPEDVTRYKRSTPVAVPAVTTEAPGAAYERVLAEAGATRPRRDAVDARIVLEVANGTGRIINDEEDVGGWPELKTKTAPADVDRDGMSDDWERRYGLAADDPEDRNGDLDGDGYTNLEEYLNGTSPS